MNEGPGLSTRALKTTNLSFLPWLPSPVSYAPTGDGANSPAAGPSFFRNSRRNSSKLTTSWIATVIT